ncbi:hypothetical protein [Methylobacterium sp. J-077]|uniref:hypothetical protein n=1 Tax=Methylobacterium sp. J-077 TaxID=2836656 RepID=UPI001FB87B60|nr:hypothetical protein [Methylobacterium sp. J-077]MCJ2123145.1 hypothetical protein [Methylobacterium sp. J-077]
MTDADAPPDKLAEVAGLATALADRILDQHVAGTTIQPKQFYMLVQATQVLQDKGVAWPPSVELVLTEIAKRADQAEGAPGDTEAGGNGDDVVVHMSQFLSDVKRP